MNRVRLQLPLPRPLRGVRLATASAPAPAGPSESEVREREQAAYERGRCEGMEALNEQLIRQRQELVELQNGVLDKLRQAVPGVVRETEQTLTALALEVAQRLVAGLPIDATLVAAAVREAMAQVEEQTEFHVHLHPEDLELLRRANSDLLDAKPGVPPVLFHPAADVPRGGCVVRTRFGVIDGRRETKLELLQKSLAA